MSSSIAAASLVMLVGPSAIGKSTLMNQVVAQNSDFGRVRVFTTRPPRSNDEAGMYRYLSISEAQEEIANGRVVQHATSPTTGMIYGTQLQDYTSRYNMLDTLSNVVDELRTLPFESTTTVTLYADPGEWHQWFLSRYPKQSDEASKRLEEAALSINWSLRDKNTYWLKNSSTMPIHETAANFIDIVLSQPTRTDVPSEALTMLALLAKGMWK